MKLFAIDAVITSCIITLLNENLHEQGKGVKNSIHLRVLNEWNNCGMPFTEKQVSDIKEFLETQKNNFISVVVIQEDDSLGNDIDNRLSFKLSQLKDNRYNLLFSDCKEKFGFEIICYLDSLLPNG